MPRQESFLFQQDVVSPTPFLKWAGGKSQLLDQFDSLFPSSNFNRYLEPFVGGGAVFFHLYNQRRIQSATLSDSNAELVNCYQVIRDEVHALIDLLRSHKERHKKEYYYQVRELDRRDDVALTPVERAARVIYLNRTCYNGLWRVNSKGQFNVPMGSYKNPRILDENNLRAVSSALQGIEVIQADFRQVVQQANEGDFIYFDPPYIPLSDTSSFTSYTKDDFGLRDQLDLAEAFTELDSKGCLVMLSNSDAPVVRDLYASFSIHVVQATRRINSEANGRGEINELVVVNYDPSTLR